MKCSARFASQERRLRRLVRVGDEFRAQLALRAKTGAFGAPSYRTGTGNQKLLDTSRDYRLTDRLTETESEQEICPEVRRKLEKSKFPNVECVQYHKITTGVAGDSQLYEIFEAAAPYHIYNGGPHHQTGVYNMGETLVL